MSEEMQEKFKNETSFDNTNKNTLLKQELEQMRNLLYKQQEELKNLKEKKTKKRKNKNRSASETNIQTYLVKQKKVH